MSEEMEVPQFIELPPCDGLLAHRDGTVTMMRAYLGSTVERLMAEAAEQARTMAITAASQQAAQPKAAMTEAQRHGLSTCINGGTQMGWISDDDARAILAAVGVR